MLFLISEIVAKTANKLFIYIILLSNSLDHKTHTLISVNKAEQRHWNHIEIRQSFNSFNMVWGFGVNKK